MRAGTRIALYALALVGLFAASYALADVLVPVSWVEAWSGTAEPGH